MMRDISAQLSQMGVEVEAAALRRQKKKAIVKC
jgi:hypothetical protein